MDKKIYKAKKIKYNKSILEMKVVYLTELDGDIDDVIAAEYLFKKNV